MYNRTIPLNNVPLRLVLNGRLDYMLVVFSMFGLLLAVMVLIHDDDDQCVFLVFNLLQCSG